MKIALDYDQTFTADPTLWALFIQAARAQGHDIRIVTARDEHLDRTAMLAELEKRIPIIYCRGIAKKWYCAHFGEGFCPDIWIDDKPESISNNSSSTPDFLVEWRTARNEGPTIPLTPVWEHGPENL